MTEWAFWAGPDVGVVVVAERRPALLSHVLATGGAGGQHTIRLTFDEHAGASANAQEITGNYKGIGWRCRVGLGDEGGLEISFRSRLFREYLALHIALLPALLRVLLERDTALVHGAAFAGGAGGDSATLLASMTGTGKTSLLLGAIARGGAYVGDEYLAVSAQGRVAPVVRTVALRRSSLRLAQQLTASLGLVRRLGLGAAALATALTGGRLEPLNHVRPEELGLRVLDGGADLRRACWLQSTEPGTPVTRERLAVEDLIGELSMMQQVHQVAYADIGPALDEAHGDTSARWRETLAGGLAGAKIMRLHYPPQSLGGALDEVLSLEHS